MSGTLSTAKVIYVLMLHTLDHGWEVALIKGNPFQTKAHCDIVKTVIDKRNIRYLYGTYFTKVKCVPRTIKNVKQN